MKNEKGQETGSKKQEQLKARQSRAKKAQRKKQLTNITFIILGAALLIFVLIWPSIQPVEGLTAPVARSHPNSNFNAVGDPNAPLVIEEFSDYFCSHCRNFFAENEQALFEEYVETGKVYFIYNSFGYLNADAGRAAEATYCAGDQDMFWEMHDYIFTNYDYALTNGYSERVLEFMAEDLGLDVDEFNACLQSGKYQDTVNQDQIDAIDAGIQGTPSFLFNGVLTIRGNADYTYFQDEIDAALAELGN